MKPKPLLRFVQIWNLCFGFLGIQIGFSLQNANVSRIFQTLGADTGNLAVYWVAAPLTGLIVQPIVGYMSDRTWNRFGRRRPYFTIGAVLATLSLFAMPHSPALWFAVGMLWILDASLNISMEPFRALVGDMLPERQRTVAFSLQTFFIGIGAVLGSALPWIVSNGFGVANTAPAGEIPASLKAAFYMGGGLFLAAVMWTVWRTREYPPEALAAFDAARPAARTPAQSPPRCPDKYRNGGLFTAAVAALGGYLILRFGLDRQLYIMAAAFLAFGLLQLAVSYLGRRGRSENGVYQVVHDLFHMPRVMKQLALVQFFSWFALFCLWVYGTPAVTAWHYGASDPSSPAYGDGADWLGLLFAAYNAIAALAAIAIPFVAHRLGCRWCHALSLCLGGLCLLSFYLIQEPKLLMYPMIGIGIAWASILSLPYALLSNNLPARKMGVYMGIFNVFIVIPQVTVAGVLGPILQTFFDSQAIYALLVGGSLMIVAGLATLFVDRAAEPRP